MHLSAILLAVVMAATPTPNPMHSNHMMGKPSPKPTSHMMSSHMSGNHMSGHMSPKPKPSSRP